MVKRYRIYESSETLRQLIRENNMLLMVLSRFNIPFGFGDATVAQVCKANGVDTATFLAVCNLLTAGYAEPSKVSIPDLIDYLSRTHTSFTEVSFPRIRQHLIEAINYSDADDVSIMLIRFLDDYVKEVKHHMEYENDVIFRYAEKLLKGEKDDTHKISDFSANHGHMAAKLQELKDLFIYHYKQAENTRLSVTLFDIIMCEKDLLAHFDVENRLFIPAVGLLEQSRNVSSLSNTKEDQVESQSPADLLGEREKDILRCVAQGKSNKEIADELFISVHTVTTHRRNICAKLGIHSAAGLTVFAIIHKIVNIQDVKPL